MSQAAENMDISKQQLADLKEEINAVSLKIDEEKAELKNLASDDKAYYKDSIKVLNSRLEVLIADRSRLLAALSPSAPALGEPRRSLPTPRLPHFVRVHRSLLVRPPLLFFVGLVGITLLCCVSPVVCMRGRTFVCRRLVL